MEVPRAALFNRGVVRNIQNSNFVVCPTVADHRYRSRPREGPAGPLCRRYRKSSSLASAPPPRPPPRAPRRPRCAITKSPRRPRKKAPQTDGGGGAVHACRSLRTRTTGWLLEIRNKKVVSLSATVGEGTSRGRWTTTTTITVGTGDRPRPRVRPESKGKS